MLSTSHISSAHSDRAHQFLFSVLDKVEVGVAVVNSSCRAIYMNASGRRMLGAPAGGLPEWAQAHVNSMVHALARTDQLVQRWEHDELVLRVRARPLDEYGDLFALELRVTRAAANQPVAGHLARGLSLSPSDAKLLALVWRGLSNDEIATQLGVRLGTVKSRLFRLYQRLGVKRRPAAVLRAAEILAS